MREAGFTIVEVLVAAVILVIGALTTFGLLSAAARNTERAKETQVALDLAQQEVEAMHSLTNEELAMTATPPQSSDALNPNFRVNASAGTFALSREPVGSYRALVHNGGTIEGVGTSEEGKLIKNGVVTPGPTKFKNGDVTGEVYRYVVWRNDEVCGSACPTQQDYKQIIVAVKLDKTANQAGERGYVEVQSNFVDPTDNPEKDPVPDANGNVVTAQQFFLTDTPCSSEGEWEEISGDHPLHNTLGTCASGPQTGSTAGAPDALLLGGPPDPAPEDPTDPLLYDYSNDPYLEPALNPGKDKGLQIRPDEKINSCLYDPAKETTSLHPESQVHRWVTDPLSSPFTLTGKVTLEFYTRTINETQHKGTVCVYLFRREETGSPPVATDLLLNNKAGSTPYWTFTPEANANWPSKEWGRVRLTMDFISPPYTLPVGDRLGVALSVERKNTPAEAIQIMYDHPTYPTRIEVDTNSPIEGG